MLINLTEILSFEGVTKEISKEIPIRQVQFGNYSYSLKDNVHTTLKLLSLENKELIITGIVDATLLIPCDRCMEEVTYKIKADFSKDVKFDVDNTQENIPYINGYNLDLEKLVLNELFVNLPMKVLCDDNCKGICNNCGVNLNKDSCNCETDDIDPRLAVLKDLFNEL